MALSRNNERLEILFLFSQRTCKFGMEGKTLCDVTSLQSSTREVRPDSPYKERRSLNTEWVKDHTRMLCNYAHDRECIQYDNPFPNSYPTLPFTQHDTLYLTILHMRMPDRDMWSPVLVKQVYFSPPITAWPVKIAVHPQKHICFVCHTQMSMTVLVL